MKKLITALMVLTMSLSVSVFGYANDMEVALYNDEVNMELYNVKTGEQQL